ncbi:MAG TPA: hypothetical protein VGE52_06820, partial [Pirellulales bacterium]
MRFLDGLPAFLIACVYAWLMAADPAQPQVEKTLDGPSGVRFIVRMQGPYDADVPLQAVCYFKHKAAGDKTAG